MLMFVVSIGTFYLRTVIDPNTIEQSHCFEEYSTSVGRVSVAFRELLEVTADIGPYALYY